MTEHDGSRAAASTGDREDLTPAGFETVESYDIDDGVVLFDAENLLAWVRTDAPARLENQR
jgi:hypothetical protein